MNMDCPYCKNDMKEGFIPRDRYSIKWIPGEDSGIFAQFRKGIKLTRTLEDGSVAAYFCEGCKKIIIDLDDIH